MRLAISTTAFARALAAGDLTQLELLGLCAGKLGVDGVVLELAHFPRRDREYLAQVKKLAADLAISLVAVRDDDLPVSSSSEALSVAAAVGAPYVLTRTPAAGNDPVSVYNQALGILAHAVAEAKRVNVTLAVRNVPDSLADDAFELSRLRKEVDSAWLCFALDVAAFPSGAIDEGIRKRVVLAYHCLRSVARDGRDPHGDAIVAGLPHFPGFLCLDYDGEEAETSAVERLVLGWKVALASAMRKGNSEVA